MKILKFVIFLLLLSSPSYADDGFGGKWSSVSDTISLDLTLSQNGDSITGYHCSVTANANRIDCSTDGNVFGITLRGTIKGNSINVTFMSTYSMKTGEAVITKKGKYLIWKITKAPDGEFYIPMEATLIKKK
jgi:hypothetical protein